jgi:Gpi18-like mannosyltransferase
VTTVFAVHWAFVTLFAALGTRHAYAMPVVKAVGFSLPELNGWRAYVIQPLRNWDGFWYSLIAMEGYQSHPATTAFWPLYPWTMRFLSEVSGITIEAAGLILANVAFLMALIVLQRLARLEWGDAIARRTTILLAFFPTAFYFSAVYSESFFLLFSLLAFYWARTGRWWQAGIAAALAALTRNLGVLLILPLGLMYLRQHGIDPRFWSLRAITPGLPVLGPTIYFFYLYRTWDDPFITLNVQQGWARKSAMPWEAFAMAFEQWNVGWLRMFISAPGWSTVTSFEFRFLFSEYESLDIIVTLLAIPVVLFCLVRLPVEYGAYTGILFVLPLFSPSFVHPLMSYSRFVIVLFPLFVCLAMLIRRPVIFVLTLILSTILLAGLTIQFSTWFWVA